MKTNLLLIMALFAIVTPLVVRAQASLKPFEDALAIANSLQGNNQDYEQVLLKYAANGDIKSLVTGNFFLKEHKQLSDAAVKANQSVTKKLIDIQAANSGYSFIPQHQAIDALGTFIAERFKQELNIAFLNKFRDKLKEQRDLQLMLPTTYTFLLANEPYNYTSFLESLRASLKQDLENIPSNALALTRAHQSDLTPTPLSDDQYVGLIMGLEAVNSFLKKNSSAQILIDLTGVTEGTNIKDKNFKFSVRLTNAAVTELMDNISRDWYSESLMKKVLGNYETRLLFLGLFYEKHKTIFSDAGLEGSIAKLQEYMGKVYRSYTVVNDYQDLLKGVRQTTGEKITMTEVTQYANITINVAEQLLDIKDSFGLSFSTNVVKDNIIPYARRSLAIIIDIDEKEYANAFVNTVSLTADLVPSNTTFKSDFVKYGNFAVSIVTAENSEAMVQALESAALPVGSYKIKRESFSNISLNAYAGGFLGIEFLKERGGVNLPDDVESSAWSGGFTVPVGVSFSFGSRTKYDAKEHASHRRFTGSDKKEKVLTGSSWSLFVSAIDLGAVTAFRLTNDKAETLPEVKFQNILAPGAYIVHGFKKVPISWGFGAQYGPQVRKIADLGSEQDLISAWSVRTFIAVDIPLINFFTKNEK